MNVILALFLVALARLAKCNENISVVVGFTGARDDNYLRFLDSVKSVRCRPILIKPNAPSMQRNVLLKTIEKLPEDQLVLYLASASDSVFVQPLDKIKSVFEETGASVLFAGSQSCEEPEFADKFSEVVGHGLKFPSSQVVMGKSKHLKTLLQTKSVRADEPDSKFFLRTFLEKNSSIPNMKIDHFAEVFGVVDGNNTILHFDQDSEKYAVMNKVFWSEAPVLVAKGFQGNVLLNRYMDYLNLRSKKAEKRTKLGSPFPTLTLVVLITKRSPFFTQYYEKILAQSYPKDRINLVVVNRVPLHETFRATLEAESPKYASIKYVKPTDDSIYELGLTTARSFESDFYCFLDTSVHLDNAKALEELVSFNKTVLSPLLRRPTAFWSNFWGTLNPSGFYERSFDYFDLVENKVRGTWNVPLVSSIYVVSKSVISELSYRFSENWLGIGESFKDDPEMTFCNNLRRKGIHMHVTNLVDFGHLVDIDGEDAGVPDDVFEFYEVKRNPKDWEKLYIHPDYWKYIEGDQEAVQPCQDVFRFHVVTDEFCDVVVKIMESFGKWSDGSHDDERLSGGYENVPTRDIHMKQVGLKQQWDEFLNRYVKPLQRIVFEGYYNEPPTSSMQFVVRYRPDEQPSLKPHNDASTYTISIALNRVGTDFEGGGVRFLRYDCSITDTQKGWMIMHPGRLTHYHEGLLTTKGTRYILVTFIDP